MGIKMDGKALADKICLDLKARCDVLKSRNINPVLTIVTSGEDSASKVYVRNKVRRCEEIGIKADVQHYDCLTEQDFLDLNREVDNPIIVQEPITGEVDHDFVAEYLNLVQDVDGFADYNVARLATGGRPYNYPCTPNGVMALLHEYGVEIEGKNALVIGRSNIVGRPMAMMLEHEGATVTIAHSKTKSLMPLINRADIIVSATGHRMTSLERDIESYCSVSVDDRKFKTIVDVGMNRNENGKLCGDFSEDFKVKFGFYTPDIGGTGPMTVIMLMTNTIKFYERDLTFI